MPVVGRAAAAASSIETSHANRYRKSRDQHQRRKASRTRRRPPEFLGCFRSKAANRLVYWCRDIRDSSLFQIFIILVIFGAGLLVGIQTYPLSGVFAELVGVLDDMVLWIFVLELVVKLAAEGRYPWRFFKDLWNCFDFLIVALGFMPFTGGQAVTVLRLVRLLRVLKLVRALPKLRVLVIGLLKSLSSIVYIGMLLILLFYLYAVVGVSVFGTADPLFMGNLHTAFITLFRASTLEDWTDLLYTHQFGCDVFGYDGVMDACIAPQAFGVVAVVYWITFIILSSMIILNLFIGVITSSMQDAKNDISDEAVDEVADEDEDDDEDNVIETKLMDLSELMALITDEVEAFAQLEKQRRSAAMPPPPSRPLGPHDGHAPGAEQPVSAPASGAFRTMAVRAAKSASPDGKQVPLQ